MVFTADGRKQTAPNNRLRRPQGAESKSRPCNIVFFDNAASWPKWLCLALWRISLFKYNAEPFAFAGASHPSPYRCHGRKIPCRMRKRIQILVVQRQNNASAHPNQQMPFGKRYSAHSSFPQVPLPVSSFCAGCRKARRTGNSANRFPLARCMACAWYPFFFPPLAHLPFATGSSNPLVGRIYPSNRI